MEEVGFGGGAENGGDPDKPKENKGGLEERRPLVKSAGETTAVDSRHRVLFLLPLKTRRRSPSVPFSFIRFHPFPLPHLPSQGPQFQLTLEALDQTPRLPSRYAPKMSPGRGWRRRWLRGLLIGRRLTTRGSSAWWCRTLG